MTSNHSYLRPLVGPLFLPTFLTALMLGVAEPVLPLYLQEAGASYALIGVLISASEIGRLLSALPGSGVLSRWAMRPTMMAGLAVVTAALLLMASVPSTAVFFVSWFMAGVGLTLYELARHQFIATHIANHRRGRAVSTIGGIFRLAMVAGPALGGWVAQAMGFGAVFWIMAGFTILTAVVVWRFMPREAAPQTTFSLRDYNLELLHTLQKHWRILLVAGGGQLMMQMVRRTRSVIIPLYGANVLGLEVVTVGAVISTGAALDTVLFPAAGWIVDRFGRKMAIVPSLLLQGTGLLLLPLTASVGALTAVVSLIGLGNGISAGTMLTLGADLAPVENRTPFLGLWRISSSLGFALGPNVVGSVAALLTLPLASVTAGSIGLLAALLFTRFVPETLERQVGSVARNR